MRLKQDKKNYSFNSEHQKYFASLASIKRLIIYIYIYIYKFELPWWIDMAHLTFISNGTSSECAAGCNVDNK